jgi:hypothetical protein
MTKKKECRVCEESKTLDKFDTYRDKRSGLDHPISHCKSCNPVECPACRQETIFKLNGKKNKIKFYKFDRKNFFSGWTNVKIGWLCSCGYLVSVPKDKFYAGKIY